MSVARATWSALAASLSLSTANAEPASQSNALRSVVAPNRRSLDRAIENRVWPASLLLKLNCVVWPAKVREIRSGTGFLAEVNHQTVVVTARHVLVHRKSDFCSLDAYRTDGRDAGSQPQPVFEKLPLALDHAQCSKRSDLAKVPLPTNADELRTLSDMLGSDPARVRLELSLTSAQRGDRFRYYGFRYAQKLFNCESEYEGAQTVAVGGLPSGVTKQLMEYRSPAPDQHLLGLTGSTPAPGMSGGPVIGGYEQDVRKARVVGVMLMQDQERALASPAQDLASGTWDQCVADDREPLPPVALVGVGDPHCYFALESDQLPVSIEHRSVSLAHRDRCSGRSSTESNSPLLQVEASQTRQCDNSDPAMFKPELSNVERFHLGPLDIYLPRAVTKDFPAKLSEHCNYEASYLMGGRRVRLFMGVFEGGSDQISPNKIVISHSHPESPQANQHDPVTFATKRTIEHGFFTQYETVQGLQTLHWYVAKHEADGRTAYFALETSTHADDEFNGLRYLVLHAGWSAKQPPAPRLNEAPSGSAGPTLP